MPPASVNLWTSGAYRGFQVPWPIAQESRLLPDVTIWGLWLVLIIPKRISF